MKSWISNKSLGHGTCLSITPLSWVIKTYNVGNKWTPLFFLNFSVVWIHVGKEKKARHLHSSAGSLLHAQARRPWLTPPVYFSSGKFPFVLSNPQHLPCFHELSRDKTCIDPKDCMAATYKNNARYFKTHTSFIKWKCKIVKLINKGAMPAQIQIFKEVGIRVWRTKAVWNLESMLFFVCILNSVMCGRRLLVTSRPLSPK